MRRASGLAAGLLGLVCAIALQAAPAHASGSGDVQCYYLNNQIVGVWVHVTSGGTSGWATRWDDGNGGNFYSYAAIDNGATYDLHIGCAGTPQNWGTTFYTSSGTGYHDWVCSKLHGCVES